VALRSRVTGLSVGETEGDSAAGVGGAEGASGAPA